MYVGKSGGTAELFRPFLCEGTFFYLIGNCDEFPIKQKTLREDVQWFWEEYVSFRWPESRTKSHVRSTWIYGTIRVINISQNDKTEQSDTFMNK